MRPAYAYFGIGIVMLLAILAFVNPSFMRGRNTDTPGTLQSSSGATNMTLSLTSPAFSPNASIPSQYTCDGANTSPALTISGVPEEAKSLALLMDDPDVPKQLKPDGVFDHWVVFNIPTRITEIPADGSVGVAGVNGAGRNAYTGPCPPPQYEPSEHRYFFRLYALDTELPLKTGASKQDVLHAMQGHILVQAELVGKYKKQ